MKKLLLFLALWSGAACAMQADATSATDITGATPVKQEQSCLIHLSVDQAAWLTPEVQKQALAKASKYIQEIVRACHNDKELLKKMLIKRVKELMQDALMDDTIEGTKLLAAAFTCNVLLSSTFTIPEKQAQPWLINLSVDGATWLTQEERKQALDKACKNIQEILNACRNDKKILKKMLIKRVKELMQVSLENDSIDGIKLLVADFTCNVLITATWNYLKSLSK